MDNLTQRLIEELTNNKNSFDEAVKAVFKGELLRVINDVLITKLTGYLGFKRMLKD